MSSTYHPRGWPVGRPIAKPTAGIRYGQGGGNGNGTGPVDPTWLAGGVAPTIVGANVTLDSTLNTIAYSDTILANFNDGLKVYVEFLIGADYTTGGSGELRLGLRSAGNKTNAGKTAGIMIRSQGATQIINTNVSGTTTKVPTNMAGFPFAEGAVVGLAIDGVANKIYYHLDGTWAADATQGGDPSGADGWPLVGTEDTTLHLQVNNLNNGAGDILVTYYNSGLYLPTGYTHLLS